jgi:topoisomerase-4 subunit B
VYKRQIQGRCTEDHDGVDRTTGDGTQITFDPDPAIFGPIGWRNEVIREHLWHVACLHSGLVLVHDGHEIMSRAGVGDLLPILLAGQEPCYPLLQSKADCLWWICTHAPRAGEHLLSFVNGQFTKGGGTHLAAFQEGLLRGINAFSSRGFTADDLRDGLTGVVALRLQDPQFTSRVKTKLIDPEVRCWMVPTIAAAVERLLHSQRDLAQQVIGKLLDNQRLRADLNKIR